MTAMIGEIEKNRHHDGDRDHDYDDESSIPEMFRSTSGLLDSLDKLTNEIKANLLSDEEPGSVTGSNESSSNDEDYYWDDDDCSEDEDPDSGENKLFSMMDDLVEELMMELQDDSIDEGEKVNQSVVDEETGESALNKEQHTCTPEIVGEITKDDHQNATESDDSVPPSLVCASSEDGVSSASNLNSSQPIDDREEKQKKLHQHVKTLLGQVTELKDSMNVRKRKAIKNEYNDKISANIQRKIEQGDYDADRVEHLMGTIATYSKFREANTNTIPSLSSPTTVRPTVKIQKKKRKKRTNKHKRRKSKSFVQTLQSLEILSDSLVALDEKLSR